MLTNNIKNKSLPRIFLSLSLLSILSLSFFFFFIFNPTTTHQISQSAPHSISINVYVADLPRSYNYDLLNVYWSSSSSPDSRIPSDPDHDPTRPRPHRGKYPPYPENPLIKQYSAEYWLLGDLETREESRPHSIAKRVFNEDEADVVFVPFFATLSSEMELAKEKSFFKKKTMENEDYKRQREVVDMVKNSRAWKRLGGRDHVFVLTGIDCLADPVAMWHVRADIAPAILLVVDFGGWYRLDSKSKSVNITPNGNSSEMVLIQHTQVSLLKDVIVPYTHLLPRLELKHNQKRRNLLYFKGAKHRHRGGVVREKLWDLLVNEPGVVMEEGFPNATGREQSIKGMRSSEFCLHPAGDTPTSCRLFDAIQSLCIPVIVSDNIELPFEGMIDYSEFSVFVAVSDALTPSWLVVHLRSFSGLQREQFRRKMAEVQPMFVYDNAHPGGVGPIPLDGAVNQIWSKIHQKLPVIRENIAREKRKPQGVSMPLRCHCS